MSDNKMVIEREEYDDMKGIIHRLQNRSMMDGDDKFWVSCWSIIAIVILMIAAFITYFNHAEVMVFKELAEKSPENALQIACAQDAQTSQTSTACMIYLSKGK